MSIDKQQDLLGKEHLNVGFSAGQGYKGSYSTTTYYIPRIQYFLAVKIKELYSLLSESVLDSYYGYKIGEYLNREQKLIDGSMAPHFQLPTSKGQLMGLDQFRGKYVLLNFWASWCGPCRLKNRELVGLEYKLNNDLCIMSISLDTERGKWLEASKKDSVSWLNICDLQGFGSPVVHDYAVGGIPKSFLISPQGIIVGTNLSFVEVERIVNDK